MKPVETSHTDGCIMHPFFSIAATAELIKIFSDRQLESACLLGYKHNGLFIDYVRETPYSSRSHGELVIDAESTDTLLKEWEASGVKLCGFIHSHLNDCEDFSPEDVEFAKMLISAKALSNLWFGLAYEKDGHLIVSLSIISGEEDGLAYAPVGKITLKKAGNGD